MVEKSRRAPDSRPMAARVRPRRGRAGRGRPVSARSSHTLSAARDSGALPETGAHTCRPARHPSGLRPAGLTASAARRPPPPSCTTTSFLRSPPAPPRAATSAAALPVTLARRPQRPASSHPFPRLAESRPERVAVEDKLVRELEHAREAASDRSATKSAVTYPLRIGGAGWGERRSCGSCGAGVKWIAGARKPVQTA
ncbi:uncharacterized protein LOC144579519 [Callithrix jacchus]